MRAARNFQEDFVRTFRIPVQDSLPGQVLQTAQPVVMDQSVPKKIKTAYLVSSLMYVPIMFKDRAIGVLGVDNRHSGHPFSDDQLTMVSVLADYAAIAIENARLFEQTQRAAKYEQTLREIASRVRSSTEPAAIARTAIRELGLALGRQTFIRLGDAEHLTRPPQANQETPASGNGHNAGLEGGQ